MSNVTCVACKQRKKEENFSAHSLKSGSPTCALCDVKSLMLRIEDSRRSVLSIAKQQQTVVNVSKKVEETTSDNKPNKKTSSHSRLKGLLLS
jgi:hypothetical protein